MQDLLSETQKQWPKSLSKNLLVSGMLRATGCSDYQEKANNSWLLPSMEVIQRRQHFDYNYARPAPQCRSETNAFERPSFIWAFQPSGIFYGVSAPQRSTICDRASDFRDILLKVFMLEFG